MNKSRDTASERFGEDDFRTDRDSDTRLLNQLGRLARRCAAVNHLPLPLHEDFEVEFVEKMWRHNIVDRRKIMSESLFLSWLWRCAVHLMIDFLRVESRRSRRETLYCQEAVQSAFQSCWAADQLANNGEICILQAELHARFQKALERLNPNHRRLIQSHLAGASIRELAQQQNCSEATVRKTLFYVRGRVRALLAIQGMDEREAREYIRDINSSTERMRDGSFGPGKATRSDSGDSDTG